MISTQISPPKYTDHIYQAVDLISGWTIQAREFPEITKYVRKRVKLRHGNRLRTILLEKGVVYAEGRNRNGKDIYYNFEITIHRW